MSLRITYRTFLWLLTASVVGWAGSAHAAAGWYCDPLHGFYPAVRSCPHSWRWAVQDQSSQTPEAEAVSPAPKPPADTGGLPTFQAPPSFARGDQLDEWCKGKTTAINFAVCSDDELRKLALERLRAFNEANARLPADQQKVLTADQNGWALSYPQACGFSTATPPALPLASSVKECLADAGRKRLSYLRSYGLAAATDAPSPAAGATANPATASASQAQALPPADSGSRDKSPTASAQIPPAQQNEAAAPAAPSGSAPARQEAKPAANEKSPTEKSPAGDKSTTWSTIPGTAKIAALLIAAMVVGVWVGSGLRRRRRPNRDNRSSPTA